MGGCWLWRWGARAVLWEWYPERALLEASGKWASRANSCEETRLTRTRLEAGPAPSLLLRTPPSQCLDFDLITCKEQKTQ